MTKKPIYWTLFVLILLTSCGDSQPDLSGVVITKADLEKVGTSVPASEIGEPVGSVKLYEPRWVEADETNPAYAVVEGSIMPVDPEGWPINFRLLLPEKWSKRAMQQGGGGMNGTITVREGNNPMLQKGFALYGSDSGHQVEPRGYPGAPQQELLATGPTTGDEWSLNEEAIRNIAFMQMKKTHDAVMVILERVYGYEPVYNYYVGTSHGGREGLTVAQRYPEDYEGIISNVPIVNFSTLMLAPELMKIQEKPIANWVTPQKTNAIIAEFMRQCDGLDGLNDGIINNYKAARAIFNVNDGEGTDDPWAAMRASGGVDPDPEDDSVNAKLTDGQIETLELTYSNYEFATPLANGVESFGMWMPGSDPGGFGMIANTRYKGQEGAAEDAPMHSSLGILGVTGFLLQDLDANPLDYVEGGQWNSRREQLSEWLDSTNPDLSEFYERGGKIIMTIGTADNIASSGAQLDYYQSLLDEMGQNTIDDFARLYVVPQAGHGLSGRSAEINGMGESVTVKSIPSPNSSDKMDMIMNWVENDIAPSKTLVITDEGRITEQKAGKGYLLCSYPNYPQYISGSADEVASYESTAP